MTLRRIISGGQTGADQGGLIAGKLLGLETGGTAPYNWMTEKGPEKNLLENYGLIPGPYDPKTYPIRTAENVRNSDGTVWFGTIGTPGHRATKNAARKFGKLFLSNPDELGLGFWLNSHNIKVLNVAGNRASKSPKIQQYVSNFLTNVLGNRNEQSPCPETP